jgi:viologen exporter family transport system permease protein
MHFFKSLSFFYHLFLTSVKASMNIRGAFIFETLLMVANNLVFFSVWWIFFRQFNDIAGWQIKEMTVMMAIGTGAYGLMQICFGGVRQLSRTIIQGDLDPYMTQPKNLLVHLVGSRSLAKGWGHLLTTFLLIFIENLYSCQNLVLVTIGVICGSLVFTSMSIIAHSLAFWTGPLESLAQKYSDSLYLFALYPTHIYSGILNLTMFTIIPAGIIGYLPVELIRNFSWSRLAVLLVSVLIFCSLAFEVFYLGLKRYESGNQFGSRA